MFTEWARHYCYQGVHVIVSPRASSASMRHWHAAAQMAAIVSGCYVLSSNRVSDVVDSRPHFDGRGIVYSLTGELLGETPATRPFLCIHIEFAMVADARRNYPATCA